MRLMSLRQCDMYVPTSWPCCVSQPELLVHGSFVSVMTIFSLPSLHNQDWHWLILNWANLKKNESPGFDLSSEARRPVKIVRTLSIPANVDIFLLDFCMMWKSVWQMKRFTLLTRTNYAVIHSVYWRLFSFGNWAVKSFTHTPRPGLGRNREELWRLKQWRNLKQLGKN